MFIETKDFLDSLDNLSSQEKGTVFERFLKYFFKTSPTYSKIFKEVFLWSEYISDPISGNTKGHDTGIDLVAIDFEGKRYGIQAKYHKEKLYLNDISTFLSAVGTKTFAGGILVTRSDLSEEALERIRDFSKQIEMIDIQDILEEVKKININTGEVVIKKEEKEIRPYQKEAIEKVCQGFTKSNRGQLIMPPGSGKTFTSLRITEELLPYGGLVLFLCPSISLLDQTLRNWLRDTRKDIKPIVVVSDKSVGKDVELRVAKNDLLFIPTTNTYEFIKYYERANETKEKNTLIVVFSTYQSLDVIEDAQKKNGFPSFDLIICDEAHRTAGYYNKNKEEASNFKKVHKDEYIKGKKRLYMTATPKVYQTVVEDGKAKDALIGEDYIIYSMSDKEIYGPVFFEYTFKRAVTEKYLTPYKVIIYSINAKDFENSALYAEELGKLKYEDKIKLYGLLKLLKYGFLDTNQERTIPNINRGIIFVNTVAESKLIRDNSSLLINKLKTSTNKTDKEISEVLLEINHIDGTSPASQRKKLISWLGKKEEEKKKFLINAKVLTEGIDIPSLDVISFFRPKQSIVDIIQAIGRVVRKAPDKNYGYIVIPVIINDKESEEKQINESDYATIVQILDALRSINRSFEAEIRIVCNESLKEENLKKDPASNYEKEEENTQSFLFGDFDRAILEKIVPRIMKNLGLGPKYLETWAKNVSDIAKDFSTQVYEAVEHDEAKKKYFSEFLATLRENVSKDITEKQAIEMIVQFVLTKPIFDILFGKQTDMLSEVLEKVVKVFSEILNVNDEDFKNFYERIEDKAKGLKDEQEKQEFLRTLYDNFFRIAFSKTAEQLGIAYTPAPLVDFTIRMADDIIKQEFNTKGINSPEVFILEPFSGTGTFPARIINHLAPEAAKDKFENNKLWANEILLLPYYITKVNMETAFKNKVGEKQECKSVLMTDSFYMMEKIYEESTYTTPQQSLFPEKYSELLNKQKECKINLIISNPPYFCRKETENSDIVAGAYSKLEERVRKTFAENVKTTNKASLYDSYILAMRMGLDRIQDGVIAFITNNGWLDGKAAQGVRKVLEEELDKIYIVDLKGNLRKNDRKVEGDNVFGVMVGICVVFMIKKKNKSKTKKAEIYYYNIGDGLSAQEKLEKLKKISTLNDCEFVRIMPNKLYDWINQRGEDFYKYPVLGDNKDKYNKQVLFDIYSLGLVTNRDSYVWNFSQEKLSKYIKRLIENFNIHVKKYERGEITEEDIKKKRGIDLDARHIKWDCSLLEEVQRKKTYSFEDGGTIYTGFYKPFTKQKVYFSKIFNAETYRLPKIFPTPEAHNIAIVSNITGTTDVYIVSQICNRGTLYGGSVLFPLYRFEKTSDNDVLFNNNGYQREYNISQYALQEYRKQYGDDITPEQIFYYIFGVLSNPSYIRKYQNELLKELPRIPFVKNKAQFTAISQLGEELANVLLKYEEAPFHEGLEIKISPQAPNNKEVLYKIDKMKLDKEAGKLIYNEYITITNIPQEAFVYTIDKKTPLEWIVSQYQYFYDKETDTINDPNDILKENGYTYILDLIRRLVWVSIKVEEIKRKLVEAYNFYL